MRSVSRPSSLAARFTRPARSIWRAFSVGKHRFLLRFAALTVIASSATASITLIQSYRFYAAIIDARLANGYLTSRSGIYAAPRVIVPGEKISVTDLIGSLRRAGYTEGEVSDVWNGSLTASGNQVQIHPGHAQSGPETVRVLISKEGKVTELTGDAVDLERFTVAPELLTVDLTTKNGSRAQLSYRDLPPVLVHAILSIEDHRFFEHRGMDLFGVVRAMLRNAGDDHICQGGSTITQQLVKNTYLSPERTLRRKFAEAMLAFALERRLSKEDVFALYCNEVFLGQRGAVAIRGVDQAARIYFGKDARDLSLAEAATIAGMIQGPTRYSPERHVAAALLRRNTVLGTMVRDGWISLAEAGAAAKESMTVAPPPTQTAALAPYFLDYVNRLAEKDTEAEAANSEAADQNQIYTTLDLDLQQLAEAAIKRQLDRLAQTYKDPAVQPQAALVALDPHTGAVLAMVGGRDYATSQLNRATDAERQPGSTFKPFVYESALDGGMSPVQIFTDAPRTFVYDYNRTY